MTAPEPWQPEGYYAPKDTPTQPAATGPTIADALAEYETDLTKARAALAAEKKRALAESRAVRIATREVKRLQQIVQELTAKKGT